MVQFSDEMIAKIEDDLNAGKLATRSMELNQAMDELGITSMKRLFPYAGEYEPRTRAEGCLRRGRRLNSMPSLAWSMSRGCRR